MKMLTKLKRSIKYYFSYFRSRTPVTPRFESLIWGDLVSDEPKFDSTIPKIIWIYWADEVILSPTVRTCISQIKKLHSDYEVNILNKDSIKLYLSLDFNFLEDLPPAHYSDWIRLQLLSKYGGIYIDASVLLFENLDWLLTLNKASNTEVVAYYKRDEIIDIGYPIIENWLLASIPNSRFINDWLKEFETCLLSEDPDTYYKNSELFDYRTISLDLAYYKCYYSVQSVIHRSNNYRLVLICADTDAYLYSLAVSPKWSNIAMAEILLFNKKPYKLPKMTKIINGSRRTLDEYIGDNYYQESSVLGKLLIKNDD